ncbi:MAG: carotenoid biosynthesis protein [Patescibacteria group bacterium]|jgi:uncharacterized membrane protein
MKFFRKNTTLGAKLAISIAWISILVFVYVILSENLFPALGLILPKVPAWPFVKITSAFLAAFSCFWYFRGLKTAIIGSAIMMALAWVLEFIAGHFGLFGGTYIYSGTFPGLTIAGTPLMLGPQHFAYYFFMSYFISNLLVDSTLVSSAKSWWMRSLYVSFIASIIVAGVDMMADPTQVNVYHLWQWANPSAYYNIPYGNYLGYIVVYTIILFAYKFLELKLHAKPIGSMAISIAFVPLIMHFTRFIEYSSSGLGGIALVGCFTMLLPCILAFGKLIDFQKAAKA